MAYTSCAAQIAANIQQDCNKPLVGGYTGRAVIISSTDFAKGNVITDATNPRKIMGITLPVDGSVMVYTIDNVFAAPFAGSTTAGNADTGRNAYTKTIAVRVPMRGADVSKDVIEPLVKDPDGFVVIAEKRDRVGDGSFEVIGYQNGLRGDIASVTRDESANGGDWLINLTTVETWAEVALVGADDTYESAKEVFDSLLNFEPVVLRYTTTGEASVSVTADGDIKVYKDNVLFAQGTDTLNIPADNSTAQYKVFGNILSFDGNTGDSTSAVVSVNASDCPTITSIDLSGNNELQYLNVQDCVNLTTLSMPSNGATAGTYALDTLAIARSSASVTTALSSWVVEQAAYIGDVNVYYDSTQEAFKTTVEGTSLAFAWYLVTE